MEQIESGQRKRWKTVTIRNIEKGDCVNRMGGKGRENSRVREEKTQSFCSLRKKKPIPVIHKRETYRKTL